MGYTQRFNNNNKYHANNSYHFFTLCREVHNVLSRRSSFCCSSITEQVVVTCFSSISRIFGGDGSVQSARENNGENSNNFQTGRQLNKNNI